MAYEFELIRSDRRTLALEITEDVRLLVRAPRRCPSATIRNFVENHAAWIDKHAEKQRLRAEKTRALTETEIAALIARAEWEIPPLVEKYAALMGLKPANVRITRAQKRFGSCSARNRLCFSYRLMLFPPQAVEYVVVHELSHIVHKNHGKDFYALIRSVLPDYAQRNRLLKK